MTKVYEEVILPPTRDEVIDMSRTPRTSGSFCVSFKRCTGRRMILFPNGPLVESPLVYTLLAFFLFPLLWKAFTKRVAFIGPPDSTRERGKTRRGLLCFTGPRVLQRGICT